VALGLAGLAGLWAFAAEAFGGPPQIGEALGVVAAAAWFVLLVAYLGQGPQRILADARDTALGPFLVAPVIAVFVLAGGVLDPQAPSAARAIVIAALVAGLLVCGLLTGQWLTGGLDESAAGPALILPGAGIGFVGADAAATVGLHSIAELFFGIGAVTLVLIGSVPLNRLLFRPPLASQLLPTMAIELAPAAVAGNAYFLIHPGRPDLLLLGLAGYAALMVVAQLRLLPLYRTLSFSPSFWAFTFPPANMALFALRWLELEHPAGGTSLAWLLVAGITVLIGVIAARTVVALTRHTFLPRAAALQAN
jgi:tellurite resistance protein